MPKESREARASPFPEESPAIPRSRRILAPGAAGVTLIEMMVAAGIMGFVALAAATAIQGFSASANVAQAKRDAEMNSLVLINTVKRAFLQKSFGTLVPPFSTRSGMFSHQLLDGSCAAPWNNCRALHIWTGDDAYASIFARPALSTSSVTFEMRCLAMQPSRAALTMEPFCGGFQCPTGQVPVVAVRRGAGAWRELMTVSGNAKNTLGLGLCFSATPAMLKVEARGYYYDPARDTPASRRPSFTVIKAFLPNDPTIGDNIEYVPPPP